MTEPVKSPSLAAATWPSPAWTTEERLERIEVISQRILDYVQFVNEVGDLKGTSEEAKTKAIKSFYERMTALENQLSRILEELRLG